ncbi:MAG TPA: META domain-containing protein [Terriglobales bacterium]|nr:META domain-containing protein [Terriglobales bacterium]
MKTLRTPSAQLAVLLLGFLCMGSGPQAPPSNAAADLGGTSWRLVKFEGSDDKTLTSDDPTKYTIQFESKGTASVRINCNRGHGTWSSSGPHSLEFGPLALTRAMCPPAPLNDRIVKDWAYVRSYMLRDGHLFLWLMADGGIYEFEPLGEETKAGGSVKGTALYRERMALPPDAVFEATLEDVSKADAPAEVIGRVRLDGPGNPPIHFEIRYDTSRIDPGHGYAVRGRIMVGGKLFFSTDQLYQVLTAGHGNEVELLLRRVATGESSAATESLENTYWKLTNLGNTPVPAASEQKEPHFVLDSQTRRVSGSGGCNRLTGSYELNEDHLKFSQMASTMMACLEGMDTEKAFLQALEQVNTWKIGGRQLELFDAAGNLVARFAARPTN